MELEWADVSFAQHRAAELRDLGRPADAFNLAQLAVRAGERLDRGVGAGWLAKSGTALLRASGELDQILGYSELVRAIAALDLDQLDDADGSLERAATRYAKQPAMLAEVQHFRVDLLLRQGHHLEAESLARQTIDLCRRCGMDEARYETQILLGRALSVLGQDREAEAQLAEAVDSLTRAGKADRAERGRNLLTSLRARRGARGD